MTLETTFPDLSTVCDATIAVCTYNRIGTLPRTLQSLAALRGHYDFEVLVVNGPSTDGTGEFLAQTSDVRVLNNPEINLSVSRNIAIANARGRYIAFIDDDAVPEPDWLSLVLDRMEADPAISAMGGFIRDANGIAFQAKYVFCDVFGVGVPCDNPDYVTFLARDKRFYPSLTGTNTIFRTNDLRRIGGFDEVFAYFLDETDVNKRMDDAGMRAEVLPEAEIHHKYAPSHLRTAKKVATNMYPIARSVAYFALKHGVPELGWNAAVQRLNKFYADEYRWKLDSLIGNDITHDQFEMLMHQTARGIADGIDAVFDHVQQTAPEIRLARHVAAGAPAPRRRMRDPAGTLRLCMLSQDHANANRGGIGRWTRLVARGLAERGHEVTVIGELPSSGQPEYVDFSQEGFWSHNICHFEREAATEVDCLGLPPVLANASKRRLAEMRRVMPRRAFQVVSSPIWDVEGAAILGSGLVPTVLSLHTCAGLMLQSKPEWRENEGYYANHVLRVINAEIQALRRTPLILANSRAILTDIGNLYGMDLDNRPHVIVPHGIEDIDAPKGLLEAREAAREVDPARPLRILFLGRLETRKGIKELVPVMDAILEQGLSIHLDIVGSKVDAENDALVEGLISRYPSFVTRHGFLDEVALDLLMRETDIFLAPSLYESFGLIYAEAMRYSIPCVAYATGGVPEVVEDKVDGLLAPLGDRKALQDMLMELIRNPALRHEMSVAARTNFEAKFGYALMAERLEMAYRAVVEGRTLT
ncbi:glycosyltransferase [Paracoccus versutus]|uniref:glycosyltransferase n=1 Tax=Paracoccus versutus TaxID=34007 RepID=UPI001FB657CF|nr:glycosyltransferase [Paracoccus versutus]MCJ1903261.1 glycosyltransferase [Paracoccus versutus]